MHSARTNSRGGDGAGLRAARSVVALLIPLAMTSLPVLAQTVATPNAIDAFCLNVSAGTPQAAVQ